MLSGRRLSQISAWVRAQNAKNSEYCLGLRFLLLFVVCLVNHIDATIFNILCFHYFFRSVGKGVIA